MLSNIQDLKHKYNIQNDTLQYFLKRCPISLDINDGPWLAGGSILRWFNNEEEADYDIFFNDGEQLDKAKTTMFNAGYNMEDSSSYAYTYRHHSKEFTIQLCFKEFYNTPKEVIDSFDFKVCKWICANNMILSYNKTIDHAQRKEIVIDKIQNAAYMLQRLFKYNKRGYTFDDSQIRYILHKVRTDKTIII